MAHHRRERPDGHGPVRARRPAPPSRGSAPTPPPVPS
jgi:hypothetical protein